MLCRYDAENVSEWIGMTAFALFGVAVFLLGQFASSDLVSPLSRWKDEVALIDELHNRSVTGMC
jgi:hypothetical protein